MEFGNLRVRCGPYLVLMPGDNVAAIEPAVDLQLATISIREARRRDWPLLIDGRRLLGVKDGGTTRPQVVIHWRSRDGARRAALGVDGVDGLSDDDERDVFQPRVPASMRALFAGVVHDGDGGFLLQLRRDLAPGMETHAQRARFAQSVLGALPPHSQPAGPPPS